MRHAMSGYERRVAERKQALFATIAAGERIVEIGAGADPNRRFFPDGVRWVGLEPNPYLPSTVRGAAEAMPFADACADVVISTLVLCSVRDPAGVLREVQRVLRPGGRFYFLEHVASPAGSRGRWAQRLLRPVCGFCADGCDPLRETGRTIAAAGFARVSQESFALGFPHVCGVAVQR